jgi:hypothetical protein
LYELKKLYSEQIVSQKSWICHCHHCGGYIGPSYLDEFLYKTWTGTTCTKFHRAYNGADYETCKKEQAPVSGN